jgi:hypothetical protein
MIAVRTFLTLLTLKTLFFFTLQTKNFIRTLYFITFRTHWTILFFRTCWTSSFLDLQLTYLIIHFVNSDLVSSELSSKIRSYSQDFLGIIFPLLTSCIPFGLINKTLIRLIFNSNADLPHLFIMMYLQFLTDITVWACTRTSIL